MAWLILGIIVWGALMVLTAPLLKKSPSSPKNRTEIETYKAEIARLSNVLENSSDSNLEARKIDLQRQLLTLTKKQRTRTDSPLLVINSLFAFFIFGAIGLYTLLGAPSLIQSTALEKAQPENVTQAQTKDSLPDLLAQLKSRLETTQKSDANGWLLYARTLMNVGDFPEAFKAYEEVLALTGDNPGVAGEYARAKSFAENPQAAPRGPSTADIEAAQSMSAKDRTAMIENMVSGLAQRMRDDPNNPNGWVRLLTARRVLGQNKEAESDMDIIRKTYALDPETIHLIQSKAGWAAAPEQ